MRLGLEVPVRVALMALLSSNLALRGGAQPALQPGPVLSFSVQAVQAQGMTPAGTVVWFGVGRDVQEYAAVVHPRTMDVATLTVGAQP